MKRRNFLNTISSFAATPLITLLDIEIENVRKKHLIALGTAASQLLTAYKKELDFDSYTFIDKNEPLSIFHKTKFIHFYPPESIYEMIGHLKILKNEPLPILPLSREIYQHLSCLDGDLVFIVGLGKGTGTLLLQSIQMNCRKASQKMRWVVITPFDFEGDRNKIISEAAIGQLKDNGCVFSWINLEERRSCLDNLSIRAAFEKVDGWVLEKVIERPLLG
jgi:hypothetical protein